MYQEDAMEPLNTAQVGKLLGVHERTVLNLLRRGELRGHRVGRSWKLYKADVEDFIATQRQKAFAEAHGEGRQE
jgi:excisionase family DNA binding protein